MGKLRRLFDFSFCPVGTLKMSLVPDCKCYCSSDLPLDNHGTFNLVSTVSTLLIVEHCLTRAINIPFLGSF